MKKILYLTNIPSPYMVGYLNELGKYCEVEAVFEKAVDSTRPGAWGNTLNDVNFNYKILTGINVNNKVYGDKLNIAPDDKALSFGVIKYIKQSTYDVIIVANPCTPTGIIAIAYMKFKKISYTIQSEGGFPGSGKGIKEKIKLWLMSGAKGYFSTCDLDDEYFLKYGASKNQIYRYPFTSMSQKDIPSKEYLFNKRNLTHREIRGNFEKIILTVGRGVKMKGFDVLLKVAKNLPDNVGIYFVGTSITDEYKKIIDEDNIQNTVFIDNISFDELKKYYYSADIFVLPSRYETWGLVINEAMAYGLPVITTDMCIAGTALIQDGINGYIVETDNVNMLREKLKLLIEDEEKCREMGAMNNELIQTWTLENMGKIMCDNIERFLKRG